MSGYYIGVIIFIVSGSMFGFWLVVYVKAFCKAGIFALHDLDTLHHRTYLSLFRSLYS